MVVICAAVIAKSGRLLLGRAFTPLPKSRLESYLSTFPKLVSSDTQHTFIETDAVRYLFQPMEALWAVLLTTKASNIMEDLETLRMLAKLVPEYCGGVSEADVAHNVFELSYAVDELLSEGGYREHVTLQSIRTFTDMDSHEEKLQKIIMESKMNQAKDEARRQAQAIDQQKAMQKMAMQAGGGGMGGGGSMSMGRYSSYSSDSAAGGGYGSGGYDSGASISPPETRKKSPAPDSAPSAPRPKVKGMQLSKAKKTEDLFAQLNKEEKLPPPPVRGAAGAAASSSSAAAASSAAQQRPQCVRVLLDEKFVASLDKEGSVRKIEIKGEMKLSIYDPDMSKIILQTNGALSDEKRSGYKCRLHPKINKQLWAQGKLGLADPSKSFPVGSDNAPIIVKWRKESSDESDLPFSINFWPNVEDGYTVVSIEYASERTPTPLHDVLVQIPCGASTDPPEVTSVDGDAKYDHRAKVLNWRIPLVDSDAHSSGSLEFKLPEVDADSFYPIQISFEAENTISNIQVEGVVQAESQENEVPFEVHTAVGVEKYVIED